MAIKVQFTIPLPKSWERFSPKNLFNLAKFRLMPPRCSCCGTKMLYENADSEYKFPNNAKLRVSHFVHPSGYPKTRFLICQSCVVKNIYRAKVTEQILPMFPGVDKQFDPYAITETCDCCHQGKTSYKHFSVELPDTDQFSLKESVVRHLEFRLCNNTWNSGHFCLDCVTDVLRFGKEAVSIFVYDRKTHKTYPVTKYGLPVVDGKARIPFE